MVVAELQLKHGGEVAQLRRDSTSQEVVVEPQLLQLGDVAQCRRDGAC